MAEKLLRLTEVINRVALGKTTIYRRIDAKTFPAPVSIGGNRVAWKESEITNWIQAQPSVHPDSPPSAAS